MAKTKTKVPEKLVTITGYIEEIELDDGSSGAMLYTDGDEYIIEMNKQGQKLLYEAGMEVEATGTLSRDKDGTKRLTVAYFEVMEKEEEEEEEEKEHEEEEYDEDEEVEPETDFDYDRDYGYDYPDDDDDK